jgi:hypothetical protein
MRLRETLLLLGLLLLAREVHGQADPDNVQLRNDCRFAAQVITTGHPAPHLQWAHSFIGYCGRAQWADAAASGVRRLRGSTDATALATEWRHLWMLRDSAVFEAAVDIARNRSASTQARVWALRTLANYIDPNGIYGAITDTYTDASGAHPVCVSNRAAGTVAFYEGRPLPSDFAGRARATAAMISNEPGEPGTVRTAASCVQAAPVYGVSRRVP